MSIVISILGLLRALSMSVIFTIHKCVYYRLKKEEERRRKKGRGTKDVETNKKQKLKK
jgi:rRNA-processing protein FCF1